MRYILSKEILEKFPTTSLAIIPARGIDNSEDNPEILALLRDAEEETRKKFQNMVLSEHPRIKMWREVYSAFGSKPSKYNCSIEAMARRIMKKESLPDINSIVNLYNYISIKRMISVGGDDADKIDGDVVLTLANGNEMFREIGKTGAEHPDKGEAIFRDSKDVLGRRWNWRQSDKTKIGKESRNVNLQIEGVYPVSRKEIAEAGRELTELLQKFFEINTSIYFMDKDSAFAHLK